MTDMKDYALPFAAWEARLYLDTHPENRQALALYQTLCQKYPSPHNYALIPEAMNRPCPEAPSMPLDAPACPLRWTWVDEPWPWEISRDAMNGVRRADHVDL